MSLWLTKRDTHGNTFFYTAGVPWQLLVFVMVFLILGLAMMLMILFR